MIRSKDSVEKKKLDTMMKKKVFIEADKPMLFYISP
jgi:hypothetical protein